MFILKKLNKICKKYDEDLWGLLRLKTKQSNRITESFLKKINDRSNRSTSNSLRIDVPRLVSKRRRRSLYGEILDTRKKICYFYGGLTKTEYRNLNKVASNSYGDFSLIMLRLLELRLATVVYRMNFGKTILESIHLVLGGYILVNKEVIKLPSFTLKKGDVVELHDSKKESRHNEIISNLSKDNVLLLFPAYLEVDFLTMVGIVLRDPKPLEVPFTFRFDINFFSSEFKGKF